MAMHGQTQSAFDAVTASLEPIQQFIEALVPRMKQVVDYSTSVPNERRPACSMPANAHHVWGDPTKVQGGLLVAMALCGLRWKATRTTPTARGTTLPPRSRLHRTPSSASQLQGEPPMWWVD